MRHTILQTICTILLLSTYPSGIAWSESQTEVYIGVSGDKLFAALGLSSPPAKPPSIDRRGRAYDVSQYPGINLTGIVLGVYATIDSAKQVVGEISMVLPIGPLGNVEKIGDDSQFWSASQGQSGTFYVRIENVAFSSAWIGPIGRAIEFAKSVAEKIQSDRSIAPRGRFDPLPRILSSGFPDRVSNGQRVKAVPAVEGFGDPGAVRFFIGESRFPKTLDEFNNANGVGIRVREVGVQGKGPAGSVELAVSVLGSGKRPIYVTAVNQLNVTVIESFDVEFDSKTIPDSANGGKDEK